MKILAKILFATLLCLPLTLSAQWTDSGSSITTNDKVGIGTTNPGGKLSVVIGANQRGIESISPYGGTHLPWSNGWSYLSGLGLVFRTDDNTERMRITKNGNVGIGTTNPGSKLSVVTSQNQAGISSSGPYGTTALPWSNGWSYLSGIGLIFRTNGNTERMRITSSGNVGIGTTNPGSKLSVVTSQNQTGISSSGPYGTTALPWSNGWSYLSGLGLIFRTNGNTERMRILSNGNVGIGTTNPGSFKLAVNGSIRAKEVKVESNWSDYVFYNDYKLPTLEEEEKHIEENGHLLGFESEEDMQGMIPLADVSRRQQAKIEEMMLHLIEMKKEVTQLKEENEELKKQLKNK